LFADVAAHGYDIGGIHLTSAYATGGLFSYDGVHPSAIGYGVIADVFIRTLNAVAGTTIPEPNFSDILFTPNVPNVGGASVTSNGGPWHYSFDTWRAALGTAFSPRLAVVMPAVPRAAAPALPRRPTPRTVRTLDRAHDPRD